MKADRLRTEYLKNPLGIDIDRPRLFWNCEGGVKQTAYQIVAVNDAGALLWDSGKVKSGSMQTEWGGTPVLPKTQVAWKIRLWDENDKLGAWSEAYFEAGLPKGEPWRAKWITGDYAPKKKERHPVDCFQKAFPASGIKKARLYIAACGLYEAHLNGQRVGDFVLAPGYTDYRKRVQYQTYDVTELLRDGENILTVHLADGWYRGSCGGWGLRNQYGIQTKLLAQLEMTGENGRVTTLRTGESWKWSNDGPIRFADNKDGEIVDARMVPSYASRVRVVDHSVVPSASNNVPVTEHETFTPIHITTPSGKTVLDFQQNIAGYVSFSVMAKAGQKIKLRFGELLDKNGEFTQKNIQCSNKKITTPLQEVEYTCKDGRNDYKTTFAIFGFQYVLIETDLPVDPADFTAIAVYSDMERTGWFESSSELLNKLFDCTLWSAKNNHADLPTDCPTRERHSWSGDAQIFCPTATYLFDYMALGKKYLNDLYDWQKPNGCLPQIAPEGGTDPYMKVMDGSVGWADAGVLIPYDLWKRYGDTKVLEQYLPGMRKYAAFMQGRCGKWYPTARSTGLKGREKRYLSNCGQAYGEWAEPDDVHHMTWKDCSTPHPEVAPAYTAFIMERMVEIEAALGNPAQAEGYRAFAVGCRRSYQALVETAAYRLDTDRQARLVRPLYMNLLNERQRTYAQRRLIQALENYGWRLGTGFLSTPLILDVLAEIDIAYAYRLLENEEIPGWLSMPKNGATTIWENWEGPYGSQDNIGSLNHYSKGAVLQWVFDTMCGIRLEGENRFTIAPRPGGQFTHAKADYVSVYGRVESGWQRTEDGTEFTVTIPANCTAWVSLPDGSEQEQGAGTQIYLISERRP